MMPLAEWVCLLMVCEGAYGWAVYHINQACHWIFGHHSPLTSRQPLTPRVTICWWLLLFLLPNKQCHWSSSHSFGNYCLFHEAEQLCDSYFIPFNLADFRSSLGCSPLVYGHPPTHSIHQTPIFCARKNSVKTWGILTGRKFNKGIIFYLLERNSQAVWWSLFHFILFRLSW